MWWLIPIAAVTAWILIPSKKEGKGNGNVEANSSDGGSVSGNVNSGGADHQQSDGKTQVVIPAPKPATEIVQVTAAETKPEKEESKNAADIGTPTIES